MEQRLFPQSSHSVKGIAREASQSKVTGEEVLSILFRKISSHGNEAAQLEALKLLEALVDEAELTFHQLLQERLTVLQRVLDRGGAVTSETVRKKIVSLATKWAQKFVPSLNDLLPGIAAFYLTATGQPFVAESVTHQQHQPTVTNVMDEVILNDLEGQDPEDFIKEVDSTLTLFASLTNEKTPADEAKAEALITIASNLDRYHEQLELWLELLEPGTYMDRGLVLMQRVTEALELYRNLRIGKN